jgi:hypothetical protein
MVGAFRGSFGRHRHDERFARVIDYCERHSEPFRHWWAGHEIAEQLPGTLKIVHPAFGRIRYTYSSFRATDASDLRLTVYTPATPEIAAQLTAALALG